MYKVLVEVPIEFETKEEAVDYIDLNYGIEVQTKIIESKE